jgi:hypothetical protein
MSIKIMSTVFEKSQTTANARLVLLCLADCANDEGVCWPSMRKLAQKANLSEASTKKYLNSLIEVGVVEKDEQQDYSGRQTSNLYTIIIDKIGEDYISRETRLLAYSPSRLKVREGVTRVNGGGGNPGEWVEGVTRVNGAYMNHHNEPPKEPSLPLTPKGEQASSGVPSHASDEFELIAQDLAADAEGSKSDDLSSLPPNTGNPTKGAARPKSPPRKPRQPKLVDDAFLTELAANNPRIDMDTEVRKMKNWLQSEPNRQFTQRFAVSWINRVVDKLPEKETRFNDF